MLTLYLVLADAITIQIGGHAWMFTTAFIIYLVVAAIVGLLAEFIVGWRLPFGIIGAVIAALVGIWLMTQVIIVTGFNDIDFYGVPLIRALIGAIVLVLLWHFLTYRGWHRRRRYYWR